MKQDNRYYNQTEIADLLGISKATTSRYIKKLGISGNTKNGSKIYPETTLKQLRKYIKANTKENKHSLSTIQLLQNQIQQLQDEIQDLKKDKQKLNEQLEVKDHQIEKLTQLTDQAQRLNAADKKKQLVTPKQEPKKHWWQFN